MAVFVQFLTLWRRVVGQHVTRPNVIVGCGGRRVTAVTSDFPVGIIACAEGVDVGGFDFEVIDVVVGKAGT